MPFSYESADLFFSDDGDYQVDSRGDLLDTYSDPLLGIGQAMRDRIKYTVGAWKLYPDKGVLKHPFGEYDTEENIKLYEDILRSALTFDGLIFDQDLEVDIVSLDPGTWLIAISLDIEPSLLNGEVSQRVFFLSFDLRTSRIQYY